MTQQKKIFTPDNDGIFRDNKVDNLFLPLYFHETYSFNKSSNVKLLNSELKKGSLLSNNNNIINLTISISKKINNLIFEKYNQETLNIFIDYCRIIVEVFLNRTDRLNYLIDCEQIYPKKNSYTFSFSNSPNLVGKEYSYINKNLHWALLRMIAGAEDNIIIKNKKTFNIKKILKLFKTKYLNKNLGNLSNEEIIFIPKLNRYKFLEENLKIQKNPDINLFFNSKKNNLIRKKISEIIFSEILNKINKKNIYSNKGLKKYSDFMARIMPTFLVEDANNILLKCIKLIKKKQSVKLITLGGITSAHYASFFTSTFRILNKKIFTLQHGGMIGYEQSMPMHYLSYMTYPSIFLSAGWTQYPSEYKKFKKYKLCKKNYSYC